jgi:hybrid cluster-associated redox disulfide protein
MITRKTKLGELVSKHPDAAMQLFEKGLHCAGCSFAAAETLEQGAKAHGMSEKEIDALVKELNKKKK